jgi:hypothetical protein
MSDWAFNTSPPQGMAAGPGFDPTAPEPILSVDLAPPAPGVINVGFLGFPGPASPPGVIPLTSAFDTTPAMRRPQNLIGADSTKTTVDSTIWKADENTQL